MGHGEVLSISKEKKDKTLDNPVTKNSEDIQLLGVVSTGKSILLKFFGASCPNQETLAILQWGSDATEWTTVRAIVNGTADFRLWRGYVGDGDKQFRLIRRNNSSDDIEIIAWVETTNE